MASKSNKSSYYLKPGEWRYGTRKIRGVPRSVMIYKDQTGKEHLQCTKPRKEKKLPKGQTRSTYRMVNGEKRLVNITKLKNGKERVRIANPQKSGKRKN